ncbi:MAG: O-antigen ligase family protein [Pseudomonadota bacterium]
MKKIPLFLFTATLLFAPLAFGSVETWSIAIVQLLICITALLFFTQLRIHSASFLKVPGTFPLLLLLGFMLLQLLPLPPLLVRVIAPNIFQAYSPLLSLDHGNNWIPLTVNQKATLLEFLRISSYSLFYILTVQILRDGETLRKTVNIVVWLAIGIAFLAIIQKFSSPHAIYWFRQTPANSGTIGPWIYHNHYAGFMEMLCPLALALFLFHRPDVHYHESFRSKVVSLFSMPGSNLHFFLGFGVILILASVFIALSRGGMISITLGLLIFTLLMTKKQKGTIHLLPVLIFTCGILAVTWFGWDPILGKFNKAFTETGGIADGRLLIWQDCGAIIRDFFFTGSGFGTFIHAYPQYSTMPGPAIFDHAHNDYIELFTDGGIIGFSLAAWFVMAILRHGLKQLTKRRDLYTILLTVGALTAVVSILLHSVTDFNMHNGANGLYFFFLCGLVVAAANTRHHYRTSSTLLPPVNSRWAIVSFITALPLLALTVMVQGGILLAASSYKEVAEIYLNPQLSREKLIYIMETTRSAVRLDPLEGRYSYSEGNIARFQNLGPETLAGYLKAAMKDPQEGVYLQRVALTLGPDSRDQASILMAEGYKRVQNKKDIILTWAEWLLLNNQRAEAIKVLKEKTSQTPSLARDMPPLLISYNFSREEVSSVLPKTAEAWIQFGKLAEDLGNLDDTLYYRSHALDFLQLQQKEESKPWYFLQLYSFLQKQQEQDKALDVLRRGIEYHPDHPPFHLLLGDYYVKQGILYRAKEEYEQALMLEPGNEKIRQRLEKLSQ